MLPAVDGEELLSSSLRGLRYQNNGADDVQRSLYVRFRDRVSLKLCFLAVITSPVLIDFSNGEQVPCAGYHRTYQNPQAHQNGSDHITSNLAHEKRGGIMLELEITAKRKWGFTTRFREVESVGVNKTQLRRQAIKTE